MKLIGASFIIICLLVILSNCSNNSNNSNNSNKTILHPNKDSELTLLMRDMYDYYDKLKLDIEQGQIPEKIREFKEIHSAVSTEPSKAESTLYKAMSTVYLESANRLNSSKANIPEAFNIMVDNCMNCHQQMCPGPMVKIKKLYLTSSDL